MLMISRIPLNFHSRSIMIEMRLLKMLLFIVIFSIFIKTIITTFINILEPGCYALYRIIIPDVTLIPS